MSKNGRKDKSKAKPSMIKKAKIQYGTITIPYDIIKSKRIKTSEIIVDAYEVTIRTPLNKDISEIRKLVLDKASWILKKQKEYKEMVPQIVKASYQEGSTLPYLGKSCPLKIFKGQPKNSISFVEQQFVIKLQSSAKDYSDLITKLYHSWFRRITCQLTSQSST